LLPSELEERARKIKLLLMDVDGVLTDGKLYYLPGPDGEMVETKGFDSHDGVGLRSAHEVGLRTGIISGRQSPAVVTRARILGVTYIYQNCWEKLSAYKQILTEAEVGEEEAAFIGDDFTDVPVMKRVGLAIAVANAREEVKAMAHYVTNSRGGSGAVREAIELILRAQNKWQIVLDRYGIDLSL